MSHWNYRVCRETYNAGTENSEVVISIREAYYDDNGDLSGVTERPIGLSGDNLEDIADGLRKMQLAMAKPIIDLDTAFLSG